MLNSFPEFLKAIESSPSIRIFFQVFTKTPELPEVDKHFSRIHRSLTKFLKLQIFFQVFTYTPVLPEIAKHFLEFLEAIQSPKSFRIFFQVFTNITVLPGVAKHFSRICRNHKKSPNLHNIFSSVYKHSSTSRSY